MTQDIKAAYAEGVRDAEHVSRTTVKFGDIPWRASQAVVTKVLRAISQDEVADEIDRLTEEQLCDHPRTWTPRPS